MAKAKYRKIGPKKIEHVELKPVKTSDIGKWSFMVGLVIAIVIGLWAGFGSVNMNTLPIVYAVLAILGLIVGLINISSSEAQPFLVATIALMVGSSAMNSALAVFKFEEHLAMLVVAISKSLVAINYFIAPAAFVVGLLLIYRLGKD